jgi:hypothetical protein
MEKPMLKVLDSFQLAPAVTLSGLSGRRDALRKCRICGNSFLAASAGSRSCEFCRSPFHNLVSLSGAATSAVAL